MSFWDSRDFVEVGFWLQGCCQSSDLRRRHARLCQDLAERGLVFGHKRLGPPSRRPSLVLLTVQHMICGASLSPEISSFIRPHCTMSAFNRGQAASGLPSKSLGEAERREYEQRKSPRDQERRQRDEISAVGILYTGCSEFLIICRTTIVFFVWMY